MQDLTYQPGVTAWNPVTHQWVDATQHFANVTTERLKKLWDTYDGANSPLGFSGEDIYFELLRRGEGRHCPL